MADKLMICGLVICIRLYTKKTKVKPIDAVEYFGSATRMSRRTSTVEGTER